MEDEKKLIIRLPESEQEKKDFEELENREKQRYEEEYNRHVDFEGHYLSLLLLKTDKVRVYTEKVNLDQDKIKNSVVSGRTLVERSTIISIDEPTLRKYLNDIVKKFPYLKYSTDIDKNNQEMTIKIESKINKNTLVQWVSLKTEQFREPKRINHFDEKGGVWYAFFDGITAGVPVSQLEVVK